MRNVLGVWDSSADAVLRSYTGLGQGIVARIKVLAFLLHLGEYILVRRQLAILTEELLLLLRQTLDIDLVPLGWQHVVLGSSRALSKGRCEMVMRAEEEQEGARTKSQERER